MTSKSLTKNEANDIPSQIKSVKATDFGLHTSAIFKPQYMWFLVHLYVGLIPNSGGQLAELIVHIIPL